MRSRSRRRSGMLGSIDANRNDYQSGWDTDQFPNNAAELVPALYYILKAGGLGAGRLQFRRQGAPPVDRSGRPAARPYRRHRRLRRGAGRGRAADRGRQVRRSCAPSATPAGRSRGEGDAGARARRSKRSPRASPRRRSSRSRSPAGRNSTRTCSTAICERRDP